MLHFFFSQFDVSFMDMTLWDEMKDFFVGVGSGFVFWSGWDDMGDWFDNLPEGVTSKISTASRPPDKCVTKFFFLFLNQNICCGYSKELPR